MDYSPPGSYLPGIFQARIREWVAFSYWRGSSPPRDGTRESCLSCISRCSLYHHATWEVHSNCSWVKKKKIGHLVIKVFSHGSDGKVSACSARDQVQSLSREDSPGEWNGYPLQYFGLDNRMDRGAWQAVVHGVAKSLANWVTNTNDQGCT